MWGNSPGWPYNVSALVLLLLHLQRPWVDLVIEMSDQLATYLYEFYTHHHLQGRHLRKKEYRLRSLFFKEYFEKDSQLKLERKQLLSPWE